MIWMKLNKELVKGSTAMLVLSVLEKQDMYGYQIIKTVALLSDDVFSMNEGTLYPILHALEKNGDLSAYWSDADAGTRRRRYYAITVQGRKVLAELVKPDTALLFKASRGMALEELCSFCRELAEQQIWR